ncbi:perlucin-like protein [Ptychodera flava]|uniref:perlucin-like protein n=1 Tax=Ptychodera flava TaxID=63121 RepID=UPI00396A6DE4
MIHLYQCPHRQLCLPIFICDQFCFNFSSLHSIAAAHLCDCRQFEIFCQQKRDRSGNFTLFESAAKTCADRGGRLARLSDETTFKAVRDLITSKGLHEKSCIPSYGFWIGIDDIGTEGTYVWADGFPSGEEASDCTSSSTPYLNWAHSDKNPIPDNNTKKDEDHGQDCVQMWFRMGNDGQMDDEYCDLRPKGFICEYKNSCCCNESM